MPVVIRPHPHLQIAFSALVVLLIALQALLEWGGTAPLQGPVAVISFLIVPFLALEAGLVGWLFLSVAGAVTLALILQGADWLPVVRRALLTSGFYAAFFCALSLLRNVSQSSPAMEKAGTFLARQPPGRRYMALTVGAHIFALVLNYGAIQLLGALSLTSARTEPDEEIRRIRIRRMMLAIQRGFISSLPWSPLSFSVAIAVSVIPGTSWGQLLLPGLVTGVIYFGTGWAMDTIFKPKVSGGRRAVQLDPGRWTALLPLALLLAIMLTCILAVELALHIRVIGIVLVVIPAISLVWLWLQSEARGAFAARLRDYALVELNGYKHEILLLMSAGYIGITASALLGPWMAAAEIDLAALPTPVILLSLLWILPIMGQIGANPILTLSLIGPLLPTPEALGISPTALAVALICGWILTGITSPFTATTLLIARFGGITPYQVGWVWNRGFFCAVMVLLSLWVLLFAYVLG